MKKRLVSLLLVVVMLAGMLPALGITVGAATTSNEPDVVYEEGFNSGLWSIAPKGSFALSYNDINYLIWNNNYLSNFFSFNLLLHIFKS